MMKKSADHTTIYTILYHSGTADRLFSYFFVSTSVAISLRLFCCDHVIHIDNNNNRPNSHQWILSGDNAYVFIEHRHGMFRSALCFYSICNDEYFNRQYKIGEDRSGRIQFG